MKTIYKYLNEDWAYMKKTLLMFLVAMFASSPVFAEWKKFANSNDADFWLDDERVRNMGDYIQAWGIVNYYKANTNSQGSPYLSVRSLYQVDCDQEKIRTIFTAEYSEWSGKGNPLQTFDSPDNSWATIIPDSIGEALERELCK